MHHSGVPPSTSSICVRSSRIEARVRQVERHRRRPGTPSGVNHSSESQKCGRKRRPRARRARGRAARCGARACVPAMSSRRSQSRRSSSSSSRQRAHGCGGGQPRRAATGCATLAPTNAHHRIGAVARRRARVPRARAPTAVTCRPPRASAPLRRPPDERRDDDAGDEAERQHGPVARPALDGGAAGERRHVARELPVVHVEDRARDHADGGERRSRRSAPSSTRARS